MELCGAWRRLLGASRKHPSRRGFGILELAGQVTMLISQTDIEDLAQTWTQLHGAASEPHLRHMIHQMSRSGDTTWEAIYRGILKRVSARPNDSAASSRSTLRLRSGTGR